ncbi:wall-associated protein [Listeria fleischmannii FSL S10-1203]|uniref:Wall-associated protein n=1 Tax=Listeria fleischmannii FSL S10-1203 TaxID=1265822 RepID=W7DYX2_9LIST|nr:RHS repeat-associated core domain-containing protein [Listeria fleischmannii]EUJ57926.1 wall-associated protein [Listeria fleischmannii FSL S10-1203]
MKNTATTSEARANPYLYAGYTYDKEIEQYYLMARYYEPEQGVFTAYDPDPGDEDAPQTMNGYNYADNNPVMYVDPDGNWAGPIIRGVAWAWKASKPVRSKAWKSVKKKSGKVKKWSKGWSSRAPQYWKAKYISVKSGGKIKTTKSGKGYVISKNNKQVRVMGRNSGSRKKPYYRMTDKNGAYAKNGKRSSDKSKTHINLHKNWKKKMLTNFLK